MKILCDKMPKVCRECCFYKNNDSAYGTCRIMSHTFKDFYAITHRLAHCPLMGLDEIGKDDSNGKEKENG